MKALADAATQQAPILGVVLQNGLTGKGLGAGSLE
jgi:hypothetical protein